MTEPIQEIVDYLEQHHSVGSFAADETGATEVLNLLKKYLNDVTPRLAPELRKPPEGSNFTTLLVAYLFDSVEQFKMFDDAEGEARHTVDGETGGVIALLEWQRQSGFPTDADFDKFRDEVAFELGDIPFVD